MFTEAYLLQQYQDGERNLTHQQKMGRSSAIARNLPYYGALRRLYPDHWISFCGMHSRGQAVDKSFGRTLNGFIAYILEMGPVPNGMMSPTCGRKDHAIGYLKSNFEWQSKTDNSKEVTTRPGFGSWSTFDHTYSSKARQDLLSFIASNKGAYHVNAIKSATGRTCGRRIREHVESLPSCRVINYKSRHDFIVEIM